MLADYWAASQIEMIENARFQRLSIAIHHADEYSTQEAVDPQTKTTDSGRESAWRLLESTPAIAI